MAAFARLPVLDESATSMTDDDDEKTLDRVFTPNKASLYGRTIAGRTKYRDIYTFQTQTCVTLLRDITAKAPLQNSTKRKTKHVTFSDEKKETDTSAFQYGNNNINDATVFGFVYFDPKTNQVRNDGTNRSILSKYYFWEMKIENYKEWKQYCEAKQRGYKIENKINPIISIQNIGNSCYLSVNHEINVKVERHVDYDDWGSDYPAYKDVWYEVKDLGSKFNVSCKDNTSANCLWFVRRRGGMRKGSYNNNNNNNNNDSSGRTPSCKLQLIDNIVKCTKLKDQVLTFNDKIDTYSQSYSVKDGEFEIYFQNKHKKADILQPQNNKKDSKNDKNSDKNANAVRKQFLQSPRSPLAEFRRFRSTSLGSLNCSISNRTNYRQSFRFDSPNCIVLLKDETLKNQTKTGYIYFDNSRKIVRNDGNEDSMFTNYFLWEISILNFKKLKKHKSLKNIHQSKYTPKSLKDKHKEAGKFKPIISIRNLGNNSFLEVSNTVNVQTLQLPNSKLNVMIEDKGSKFAIKCIKEDDGTSEPPLWMVDKENGLYSLNMVNKNSNWLSSDYQKKKNQFLTFGKSVKIDHQENNWRLPKKTKLRIFK